jgi:hypothetical protein
MSISEDVASATSQARSVLALTATTVPGAAAFRSRPDALRAAAGGQELKQRARWAGVAPLGPCARALIALD